MRRLAFALVSVLLASTAWAQDIDPALQQAMDARDAARVAGDSEEWGRYTTDDFLATASDSAVLTKAERMASIERNVATDALQFSDVVVRTYGDTVIETSRGGALRFTNVWVMSDGQWRTAAVHLSLITDEAAAQSIVGAWTLEEAEITGGDNPRTFADRSGLMIFTATHYSQVYVTGNQPFQGAN